METVNQVSVDSTGQELFGFFVPILQGLRDARKGKRLARVAAKKAKGAGVKQITHEFNLINGGVK